MTEQEVQNLLNELSRVTEECNEAIIPFQEKIYALEQTIADQINALSKEQERVAAPFFETMAKLTAQIKSEALPIGHTVHGDKLMAMYTKPKVSWDTKGTAWDKFVDNNPSVLQFKSVAPEGTITIRGK